MRKTKKICRWIVTLVMILGMNVSVFAAEPETELQTEIKNPNMTMVEKPRETESLTETENPGTEISEAEKNSETNTESTEVDVAEKEILKKLEELKNSNAELSDYVDNYASKSKKVYKIDLSTEADSHEVPLLLQWDERWGYKEYGSGLIGYTGCGPTCMSMIALFFTQNKEYTPAYMADYAMNHGYYEWGEGTAWSFFESGCNAFGLTSEYISIDEKSMIERLEKGEKLVCSMKPGDFTQAGHFIVIRGYDSKGFYVNDPNSEYRSHRQWKADVIIPQIKKIWSIKKTESKERRVSRRKVWLHM